MNDDNYGEKKWAVKVIGKALGAVPEPFEDEGLHSACRFRLPEAVYGANVVLETYVNRDEERVVCLQGPSYSARIICKVPDIWADEVEFRNEYGDRILLTRPRLGVPAQPDRTKLSSSCPAGVTQPSSRPPSAPAC